MRLSIAKHIRSLRKRAGLLLHRSWLSWRHMLGLRQKNPLWEESQSAF